MVVVRSVSTRWLERSTNASKRPCCCSTFAAAEHQMHPIVAPVLFGMARFDPLGTSGIGVATVRLIVRWSRDHLGSVPQKARGFRVRVDVAASDRPAVGNRRMVLLG